MDDRQLLRDYTERGSETAFHELVRRHLGMVHSVALREVRDMPLAEEVSQAVFILLARKARSLNQNVVIAGWLFRTTRFVATRAVRAERRRQHRESEAFKMQQLANADETWKRIAPTLDSALEQLGETDRNAILLRFFEEQNHKEVGAALSMSEEAARKRVARALERLREFFAARGFSMTVAMLASALGANAVQAAPAVLTNAVAAAAAAGGTAPVVALPAVVQETLSAWRWLKIKITGAIALSAVAAVTLALAISSPGSGSALVARDNTATENTRSAAVETVVGQSNASDSRSGGALRLRVLSRRSNEPVANAMLAVNTVAGDEWKQRFDLRTDDAGICKVPLQPDLTRLDVGIVSSGWAPGFVHWRPWLDDFIPGEYTLLVDPATNSVGGWIRDESGRPVAGAEILIGFAGGDGAYVEPAREGLGFIRDIPVTRSDREGRWSCALITLGTGFSLKATHPSLARATIEHGTRGQVQEDLTRESFRQLLAGTLITTLSNSLTLSGQVTDEAGQPLAGAEIAHQPHAISASVFHTDAAGRFAIGELASGRFDFVVTANGFAPNYQQVNLEPDLSPVQVRLKPGATVRFRTVDENGDDLPGVTIGVEQWGDRRHIVKWSGETGSDGRLEWNSAPSGDALQVYAKKAGWCYTRDVWIKADREEHVIKLRRAVVVTGRAFDAETGEPIANVKVYPGYGEGEYAWYRGDTRYSTNGVFKVPFEENNQPWRVRVEAPGYSPADSEPIASGLTGSLEIAMQRLGSDRKIAGAILLPDGRPASGAEVALCTFEQMIGVTLLKENFKPERASRITQTDNAGRFSFNPDKEAHTLVAVHAAGFARQRLPQPGRQSHLQLQPWGRIEGTVVSSGELSGEGDLRAVLSDWTASQYHGGLQLDSKVFSSAVGPDGRFTMESVPPGNFFIFLERGRREGFAPSTPVTIPPGHTVELQISTRGVRVIGRFAAGEVQVSDWVRQTEAAGLIPLGRVRLPMPAGMTPTAQKFWEVDFWQSDAGHARLSANIERSLTVGPDGSFRGDEVLPGRYRLFIHVTAGNDTPLIGDVSEDLVIPESSEVPGRVIDLGTRVLRRQ